MRKIRSGVYGLNSLLDGGINESSTTVVIGASGAGKTTLATQFIRRGLEEGQEGIFVSLDENKEQIIKEAIEMGWGEILGYIEREQLVFIDASGRDFATFIKKELPSFVEDWKGANARIVVDPLTPVLWANSDRYEQRDLIGFMLKETRKVGTVLATLEEHGSAGDLAGGETIIPMYLADCVVHLRYRALDDGADRRLKIVKCRNSRHSERSHPYSIIKGLGVIVSRGGDRPKDERRVSTQLRAELAKISSLLPKEARERIERAFAELRDSDLKSVDPAELVEDIASEYRGK
jgi:KaiC/GvpD/RAD55 family RecA-like ATPase